MNSDWIGYGAKGNAGKSRRGGGILASARWCKLQCGFGDFPRARALETGLDTQELADVEGALRFGYSIENLYYSLHLKITVSESKLCV